MANTKISDLPGTTTLTDEDAIPVVQEGITKKFTGVLTALKTLLGIGSPETLQTQSKEVVGAVNELNGKTESLEEKIGQIVTIPASQTIMQTFVSQKVGTVRQYTYSVVGTPTDYPQAFKDAGINYCPVMTIGKAAESVGMILIQDAKNSNGEPHAIFGYTTTTQTFWGSLL